MHSTFVLSTFAMMLVGGLGRVMPHWPHFNHHAMRRQENNCACMSLRPWRLYDDFTSVSDGQAACKENVQPFVDCMKGSNECTHLLFVADAYEAMCNDIEGMVASSQCFGGDAGFARLMGTCKETKRMVSERQEAETIPAEEREASSDCGDYQMYYTCLVDETLHCSAAAGRLVRNLQDIVLEGAECV